MTPPLSPLDSPPSDLPGFVIADRTDPTSYPRKGDYERALLGALEGAELGAYDRKIIQWLASWDTSTVATIVSLILRARAAAESNRPDPIAVCIGCGCDDLHACVRHPDVTGGVRSQRPMGTTPDPARLVTCHWLRLDRDAGFGVCSACAGSVERWDAGDRDPDELRLLTGEGP